MAKSLGRCRKCGRGANHVLSDCLYCGGGVRWTKEGLAEKSIAVEALRKRYEPLANKQSPKEGKEE